MKLKVAIVSDYAHFTGGICIFIENIVKHSIEEVSYSLVTWRNSFSEALAANVWGELFERIELIETGNIINAFDVMSDADLIFLQTSCNVRLLALLANDFCEQNRTPLISVLHTTSHSSPFASSKTLQDRWYKSILLTSMQVICVSQAVKDSVQCLIADEPVCVTVIDNASRFTSATVKTKNPGRSKIVSYVGRPVEAKGIKDFLEIAKSLIDTDLVFVCNSVDKDARSFLGPLPSNFQIVHSLDEAGMLDFYSKSHILVATYRHSEGLPLAILEALSLGLPVAGYASPGLQGILEQQSQFVVPVGCYELISAYLRSWWQKQITLSCPNKNAIKSWVCVADEYVNIFRETLK